MSRQIVVSNGTAYQTVLTHQQQEYICRLIDRQRNHFEGNFNESLLLTDILRKVESKEFFEALDRAFHIQSQETA